MGKAMLSKSVIQFSVEGWLYVPFLLFDLRPNYDGGNEDNGDLLQNVPFMHCYTQCPQPCSRPQQTDASARDSWTLRASLGQVSCGVTALLSWVLVYTGFVCALQESVSPVLCKFWQLYDGLMATSSKRAYAIPRSTAPRAPAHTAVHYWPMPPQETPKHSSFSVSVGYLGPGVQKVCLSSLRVSG